MHCSCCSITDEDCNLHVLTDTVCPSVCPSVCRDAVIISILDTCTAFIAGFVIFATIGFMAAETASTIDEVVTKGRSLSIVSVHC